jgi:hypothetical protein
MRAKLKITSVAKQVSGETLTLSAVYKSGAYPEDGADEDNTFAMFTPQADLVMHINNPALVGKFEPGQKFYVDFSTADVATSVPPPNTTEATVESEIIAKGLTAPRVTPADVEANISNEFYFTAEDGVVGSHRGLVAHGGELHSISTLTLCVLVLANGFTIIGESACASPENFNADLGKKIARANAVQKIWPLMGYALRERLAGPSETD